VEVEVERRSAKDRPWLPGPPPRRSNPNYRNKKYPEPRVLPPSVTVSITKLDFRDPSCVSILKPYLGQEFRGIEKVVPRRCGVVSEHIYLFHGSAEGGIERVARSFVRHGPSISFARSNGYLSREPAVYYTTSLEFALSWIYFTDYGQWSAKNWKTATLRGLVYVSKVNVKRLYQKFRCNEIPSPVTTQQEQQLQDVCYPNQRIKNG
jgi:hypothetical protein